VEDKERARCAETASLVKMKKKNSIFWVGFHLKKIKMEISF
jgi:putative methionine-R-sulfoxide reductase with GAF domain